MHGIDAKVKIILLNTTVQVHTSQILSINIILIFSGLFIDSYTHNVYKLKNTFFIRGWILAYFVFRTDLIYMNFVTDEKFTSPGASGCCKLSACMGRGGNFHYKGIYRRAAGMGYTFQASMYMNGYHFHFKRISMGYLFHPKSIWMGTIAIGSIWMGMFLTSPSIWMGWGPGTPAARPYPKSWQVTPPPPLRERILQYKIG